ncbi:unnamed protein product [Didymodactylos carnosus]|uniref:One cut domain family member n=1 Tax=Didymodactylos carnosus TaxID=1234261 RepID=A0A814HR14_9BILA|nr:unnamed protein product [Didymodactylos carnosus]CAF1050958.1 unnamed protein product [Didymodactylos carnosus]CAF3784975.1 unnamed protein product [Didymodactylos carnosus]CAF3817670.1 unnamed protein product [Didymodactylos carnosus]
MNTYSTSSNNQVGVQNNFILSQNQPSKAPKFKLFNNKSRLLPVCVKPIRTIKTAIFKHSKVKKKNVPFVNLANVNNNKTVIKETKLNNSNMAKNFVYNQFNSLFTTDNDYNETKEEPLDYYCNDNDDNDDIFDYSRIIPSNNSYRNNSIDNESDSETGIEEINTKELAQRITNELKRYTIPQAVFAQRVLCRSQGTLSDLLRNPKPWSKLKSGRETFRRMKKWLQIPEEERMTSLKIAASSYVACKRRPYDDYSTMQTNTLNLEEQISSSLPSPPSSTTSSLSLLSSEKLNKKTRSRLIFTDIQKRTLHAIFKETKRPSKEMQQTIAQQLNLDVSTVSNFFMNARRRSMDKWREYQASKSLTSYEFSSHLKQ